MKRGSSPEPAARRARRGLRANQRGATIVEFAIVLLPLCIVLMGLLDMGISTYVSAVMQGAVAEYSRRATIGDSSTTALSNLVKSQLGPLVASGYVDVQNQSYYTFSRVGKPEKLITDVNGNGSYDAGDCYEDANNNKTYDADGGANGLGGSDDILSYKVTASFPRLLPMAKLLGWSSTQIVTASTVLRNQPYASQPTPATVCN